MADSNGGAEVGGEAGTVRTLVVDCTCGCGATTYSLTVSGDLEQVDGEFEGHWVSGNPRDTVRGSTVEASLVGTAHGFRFTGEVTDFDVDASSQARIYLDGEEVRPSDLGATVEPSPEIDLVVETRTLEPDDATTVTATVTDEDGEPLSGVDVDLRLLDSPRGRGTLEPDGITTDDDGQAVVTYTAPSIGSIDRIQATVGDASAVAGVATRASTVQSPDGRDDGERSERPGGPGAIREQPSGLELR